MFADDLVLLSESPQGLQNCLNRLKDYTEKWNLTVNINKTKIIIFNKGGHKFSKFSFWFGGEKIEITQQYCYLGIIFTACGSFTAACRNLLDKASRAFFKIIQLNTRDHAQLTLRLFDSLVTPILTYAAEVWGPLAAHNINKKDFKTICDSINVEKLNIKLCKYLLGVNRKSVNDAVRGELGRYPLLITILGHSMKYWSRCESLDETTLLKQSLIDSTLHNSKDDNWCQCMQSILTKFYGSNLLDTMKVEYSNSWLYAINCSKKLRTYCTFKNDFVMENYVLIHDLRTRRCFSKLRISAHGLAIETGRYCRPPTPAENRFCILCKNHSIEDEYHMVMECPQYVNERDSFIKEITSFSIVKFEPTRSVFIQIMNYIQGDTEFSGSVCKYINACFVRRDATVLQITARPAGGP